MCCHKPSTLGRMGVGSQKMCQFWEGGELRGICKRLADSFSAGSPMLSLVCEEGPGGISSPVHAHPSPIVSLTFREDSSASGYQRCLFPTGVSQNYLTIVQH